MRRLAYLVYKELLILGRDMHGLLLLFVMPTIFILIMSLALQNQFASHQTVKIDYLLVRSSDDGAALALAQGLATMDSFRRLAGNYSLSEAQAIARRDEVQFVVHIVESFEDQLAELQPAVTIDVAPGTAPTTALLFEAQIRERLADVYLEEALYPTLIDSGMEQAVQRLEAGVEPLLISRSLFGTGSVSSEEASEVQLPSSVQQNVPAWLLFAMFFIAIPLSNTFVAERQQRTLARLQTMQVPRYLIFLGKLIPYFFINLLQVGLMLLVGMFLVPLVGGDALVMGGEYAALLCIAVAASLATVCYALFIAQVVTTTEQATILTGVLNITMAALGGVMVPRFIMPEAMQTLSQLSPMAWGLNGFLDVLLRGGGVAEVMGESLALVALALVLLLLAIALSSHRMRGV